MTNERGRVVAALHTATASDRCRRRGQDGRAGYLVLDLHLLLLLQTRQAALHAAQLALELLVELDQRRSLALHLHLIAAEAQLARAAAHTDTCGRRRGRLCGSALHTLHAGRAMSQQVVADARALIDEHGDVARHLVDGARRSQLVQLAHHRLVLEAHV